jgi:hypothetical protein
MKLNFLVMMNVSRRMAEFARDKVMAEFAGDKDKGETLFCY